MLSIKKLFNKQLIIKISHTILILLLSILFVSCTFFSGSSNNLEETIAAMSIQGTIVAQQATIDAQNIQATTIAQQATQLAQLTQPTQAVPVEITIEPTLSITETELSTQEPQTEDPQLEEKIKAAKILLFEDVSGNRIGLLRYVKEALDSGGYAFTDVGSAQGWFKDQLISLKEWDLIIAAAELSGMGPDQAKISGEYFDYINKYIESGTAVIFELPTLDQMFQGNIRPILDSCGIQFQDNWISPPISSIWFLIPEHPIFHQPNEIGPSLRDYRRVWSDSGDLVEIKYRNNQQVGDATLLAGTRVDKKTTHGTLTTCLEGRLILQTFATHHYNQEDIVRLWQNYIYFTLKNHFMKMP